MQRGTLIDIVRQSQITIALYMASPAGSGMPQASCSQNLHRPCNRQSRVDDGGGYAPRVAGGRPAFARHGYLSSWHALRISLSPNAEEQCLVSPYSDSSSLTATFAESNDLSPAGSRHRILLRRAWLAEWRCHHSPCVSFHFTFVSGDFTKLLKPVPASAASATSTARAHCCRGRLSALLGLCSPVPKI